MRNLRKERDTLGEVEVEAGALYGAQTARALANFPISGWKMPEMFLASLVLIKKAYAIANAQAGLLSENVSRAIVLACDQVLKGQLWEQFPVDVFQTGSGTSTNMNVNEVLAHLASEALTGQGKTGASVHPNDHVNLGQSSNDTVPSAARLMALEQCLKFLLPAVRQVVATLDTLARRYTRTVTLGRTHLVDAVPTTYGRVFSAWQERLTAALSRVEREALNSQRLPLGGTALGSGLGGHVQASLKACALLQEWTGFDLKLMANPSVGIQAWDDLLALAESLAHLARVLLAVSQDLRWRASGPYGGLGELLLPAVQPGSSLMPGKVNPVIPEAVAQVCLQVAGLAHACALSTSLAQLDLFHGGPLVVWNVHTMIKLMERGCLVLVERCLSGLSVNEERCRQLASRSPALATALAASLGYEQAAAVVRLAQERSLSLVEAGRQLGVPERALAALQDLESLAGL